MSVCTKCRQNGATSVEGCCATCGTALLSAPYKWSPPKKNNTRAWKRIEKGEWLWDRRRVRRNPPPAAYNPLSWISLPTHKKGQRKIFQPNIPRERGPDVDLGG